MPANSDLLEAGIIPPEPNLEVEDKPTKKGRAKKEESEETPTNE
jgi:hypothetical protein